MYQSDYVALIISHQYLLISLKAVNEDWRALY